MRTPTPIGAILGQSAATVGENKRLAAEALFILEQARGRAACTCNPGGALLDAGELRGLVNRLEWIRGAG